MYTTVAATAMIGVSAVGTGFVFVNRVRIRRMLTNVVYGSDKYPAQHRAGGFVGGHRATA